MIAEPPHTALIIALVAWLMGTVALASVIIHHLDL